MSGTREDIARFCHELMREVGDHLVTGGERVVSNPTEPSGERLRPDHIRDRLRARLFRVAWRHYNRATGGPFA